MSTRLRRRDLLPLLVVPALWALVVAAVATAAFRHLRPARVREVARAAAVGGRERGRAVVALGVVTLLALRWLWAAGRKIVAR